jgi:hypothetical protein
VLRLADFIADSPGLSQPILSTFSKTGLAASIN